MEWKHIMDSQPEDGEEIIQVDPPYEGHYTIGMTNYYTSISFEESIRISKEFEWPMPNFWWISAKDFPFPDKNEIELQK